MITRLHMKELPRFTKSDAITQITFSDADTTVIE